MLSHLIYASKAHTKMEYGQLRDLNETAATRNALLGLTGLLIYGSSCFLQVLEGDRELVSQTYTRISSDKRHHSPVLISVSEIAHRQFQQWGMRFVMVDGIHGAPIKSLLIKYGATETFQPLALSSKSASGLLADLSNGMSNAA